MVLVDNTTVRVSEGGCLVALYCVHGYSKQGSVFRTKEIYHKIGIGDAQQVERMVWER